MKVVAPDIDFADSSYRSCKTTNSDLIVYINSWDDKILKITFSNAIQFIYRGGSFIAGIYERINETAFLLEALSSYYEKIPKDLQFKVFVIIDIEDRHFFEVVAEKVLISTETVNIE